MKTLHIAIMILIATLSAFGIFLFTQLQFTHGPELTYIIRQILPDDEIEKDPEMVTIQNQTFHIMTINKISFNSNNSTEIDWYGIKFLFPHGLELTNSTDGKFIESYVTFPNESVSNKMAVAQGFVAFSTHHNPQVGILLHNETVKLLVNWTKIHSDLAIIGLNETYKTGQPIDFQIRVGGFDYFDEGAVPKIWVERQDGSLAWSQPHKDSIVLCCAPEFTDYDRKFNLTDLGGPITIDKPGSYDLTLQYADQKIQKQFSVKTFPNTMLSETRINTFSTNVINTNFTVNYNIKEGKVLGIKDNKQSGALEIFLQTTSDSVLTIDLPRALIDARIDHYDDHFFVLADGQETNFKEIKTTDIKRTLAIPFSNGTNKIEIIGTHQI